MAELKQLQNKNFDRDAIEQLNKAMETAQSNDQPFLSVDDKQQPVLVGDSTDTDSEADYKAVFHYPKGSTTEDGKDLGNGLIEIEREYKGVYVTPRKARRLRHATTVLIGAFSRLDENGVPQIMTMADLRNTYQYLDDVTLEAMEQLLVVVLGLTDFDIEYITDASLIQTAAEIIANNSGFFQ